MQLVQAVFHFSTFESNQQIETPIKRNRKQDADEIKTADSIVFTDQKSNSLNEYDPQQFFERFDEIVKISEVEEEQDEQENHSNVYRKLNYDVNTKKAKKLQFSPSFSSMTKKNKIQTAKCSNNQVRGKQLFQMMPVVSPIKRKCVLQTEVQSAENESKMSFTPTKLTKSSSHCEMAARKQSPFRELANRV